VSSRSAADLRAVPRRDVDPRAWDAVADASPDAWLWHRHAFGDALATWTDATDAAFALEERDELVAVVPLTLYRYRRLRGRLEATHATSLGGPAVSPNATGRRRDAVRRAAVEHALAVASERSGTQLEVVLSSLAPGLRGPDAPRVNPLVELGLTDASGQTWIVPLAGGADVLWRGLRDRARAEIRRAEAAGVEVRRATADDLDVYYRLHRETYERTGAAPHPRAYFARIWEDFLVCGLAEVLVAELDGTALAARSYGTYKGAALYWTGASSAAGLEVGAGALVQWRAMCGLAERGFDLTETGEAFPGTEDAKLRGLSLHKASFGGRLEPFFKARRTIPNRPLDILTSLDRLRSALAT
jgi:hypothetical protein